MILAGDIGVGLEGLPWGEERFPDRSVYYVPGNHEFYHHAPSSQAVYPRYARDLITPAFASNLKMLMDSDGSALWVRGHMHYSFDYEIHGTRVVCNPRGYAPEALNPEFRPDYIVEI